MVSKGIDDDDIALWFGERDEQSKSTRHKPAISKRHLLVRGSQISYLYSEDNLSTNKAIDNVLFFHGWAIGPWSYTGVLGYLSALARKVYAPCLPAFGGTPALPADKNDFSDYAQWVKDFTRAGGLEGRTLVVGHSFGGGVAIRFAYDAPDIVTSMVLANAIGSPVWRQLSYGRVHAVQERPLWDWGGYLAADLGSFMEVRHVLPVVLREAIPNLVAQPQAVWRAVDRIRSADLSGELSALRTRKLPVAVIWSKRDRVVTRDSYEAMCEDLGVKGKEVEGSHSWLIAHPSSFGEVMKEIIDSDGFLPETR